MSTVGDFIIREAGNAADRALPVDDPTRAFSQHLAAHAVAEVQYAGRCTKTLNMAAPCPYCGKLPPGMVFPGSARETVA